MDELKNIAPQLSEIKKENPFRAPENYFDDFSARLNAKIEAEKESETPVKSGRIIRFLKPALGLAASFALIFMLVYWPLNKFSPKNELASSSTTPSESLTETEYAMMVGSLDENSFYELIETPAEQVEFSDEELLNYVTANTSEYEIFVESNN